MPTPVASTPPAEPARPGRRELAKARHRDAIVHAAALLFRKDGFEATTIERIAEAAGVSRRTFFRYFATKDAAVFPHAEARLARIEELLVRRPGEAPIDAVRRAFVEVGREFMRARDELVLQQELIASSPVLLAREREIDDRWEAALAHALRGESTTARAQPAAEVRRARVLAAALMGAMRAALREWFASGGRADLVELGGEALDLVAGAMGTRSPGRGPRVDSASASTNEAIGPSAARVEATRGHRPQGPTRSPGRGPRVGSASASANEAIASPRRAGK